MRATGQRRHSLGRQRAAAACTNRVDYSLRMRSGAGTDDDLGRREGPARCLVAPSAGRRRRALSNEDLSPASAPFAVSDCTMLRDPRGKKNISWAEKIVLFAPFPLLAPKQIDKTTTSSIALICRLEADAKRCDFKQRTFLPTPLCAVVY